MEAVKTEATTTGTVNDTLSPGGIANVDTEASGVDLLTRLVKERNPEVSEEGEEGEGEGEGESDDATAVTEEGEEGEGEAEGKGGDDDADGESDTAADDDKALREFAESVGVLNFDKLTDKQREVFRGLLAAANEEEAAGNEDTDTDDDDDLTAYERSLLEEDEEEAQVGAKTGKDKEEKEPPAEPEVNDDQPVVKMFADFLDGKFKPLYKSDADYYAKLSKATEDNDMDAYETLQNQRFVDRTLRFAVPMVQVLVDRKLNAFADIITPALTEYSRSSAQTRIATARDTAIRELESLETKSGTKPFAEVKKFLTPDQPDKKVVINGHSHPSSPWTRVLKANPEILNIRVPGKDGRPDPTATFIAQYKAAMKFGKTVTSKPSTPVTKEVAKKLVNAGVKAGERQAKRNAAGKLNSNSSGGTGKQGNQKTDWGKHYTDLANVQGNASWIGD